MIYRDIYKSKRFFNAIMLLQNNQVILNSKTENLKKNIQARNGNCKTRIADIFCPSIKF